MTAIDQQKYGEYEVIVVGGSFAGLAAALQLARARRKVLVLDSGKPRNRYSKEAHGFLGHDGSSPKTILDTARRQISAYPTVQFVEREARKAARSNGQFQVLLEDGQEARAKRLILATGVTDHLPDIPGMKELWGTGVLHCPYCHGYEVAEQPLAILSTGEKSVHQALLVRDWSEDVTLLTHGSAGLTVDDRERLRKRNVKIVETPVARLIARGKDLVAVELQDGSRLPLGGLFTMPRCTLTSPIAEQLGCELEPGVFGPIIRTDASKETTVPGVFAAGDAARMMQNVTLASADGVLAGISAHQSLVFR